MFTSIFGFQLCLFNWFGLGPLRIKSDSKRPARAETQLKRFQNLVNLFESVANSWSKPFSKIPRDHSFYGTVTQKSANFDIFFAKTYVVKFVWFFVSRYYGTIRDYLSYF